ncbi:LolA family protein [Streptomyces sp. NBC_01304]|uniref:LolA family protein n=1 Tax=Streptomyces sp. NBC_01304 TaxID=2903818 RepID=UPI002E115269|nr:DUF2092 domain-containing protein [Streptomyces sp. NBC_01304]
MAPYGPDAPIEETDDLSDDQPGRRKAARYLVPVAVAGVAAATIGLVPALASSGDPDLPDITAQQLIEKIAASDAQQLSGNFKISTDLGLPSLGGLGGGSSFAPGGDEGKGKGGGAADPQSKLLELASGDHNLRIAVDGPDKQKLSILDKASEYSVIHNGADVWAYDSASNTAFHAKDDQAGKGKDKGDHEGAGKAPATPKELADEALKAVGDSTSVTVDGTARIAGRDAYQLLIKPKGADAAKSTIGSIRISADADNGVPLKFQLNASSGGKAVIDAGFTKVDFGKPAASTFDFKPAKGMEVTEADELAKQGPGGADLPKDFPKDLPKDLQKELPKDLPKDLGKDFKDFDKDFGKGDLGKGADGLDGLNVIGEGWGSIATFDTGEGLPSADSGELPPEAGKLLDSFGGKVNGKFGSGRVFSTKLINALITDDGKVYVGAVTKEALVDAANSAK